MKVSVTVLPSVFVILILSEPIFSTLILLLFKSELDCIVVTTVSMDAVENEKDATIFLEPIVNVEVIDVVSEIPISLCILVVCAPVCLRSCT